MAKKIDIGGELHSVATDHKVADASEIKDISKGNKSQAAFNNDVDRHEVEIHGTGGIESRLTDVEQIEQIVLDGGEAQIAQGSDFTNPDATKRAKIPTVGAIVDGLNDGIYDVSKRNPTSGPNSDGKFTLDYILNQNNVNTLIPTGWRHGGMTISFVQSSDNKYVQYSCIADEFTTDESKWAVCGNGVYINNPEYLKAETDGAGHLLFWIKVDGSIDWAIGVPKPVEDYVNSCIAEIRDGNEGTEIDGLNKVIAFLDDFSISDTLAALLNTKVDKVNGKSLIDEDVANGLSFIENPEYMDVETDSQNKILSARRKSDGVKEERVGFVSPNIETKVLEAENITVPNAKNINIGGNTLEKILDPTTNEVIYKNYLTKSTEYQYIDVTALGKMFFVHLNNQSKKAFFFSMQFCNASNTVVGVASEYYLNTNDTQIKNRNIKYGRRYLKSGEDVVFPIINPNGYPILRLNTPDIAVGCNVYVEVFTETYGYSLSKNYMTMPFLGEGHMYIQPASYVYCHVSRMANIGKYLLIHMGGADYDINADVAFYLKGAYQTLAIIDKGNYGNVVYKKVDGFPSASDDYEYGDANIRMCAKDNDLYYHYHISDGENTATAFITKKFDTLKFEFTEAETCKLSYNVGGTDYLVDYTKSNEIAMINAICGLSIPDAPSGRNETGDMRYYDGYFYKFISGQIYTDHSAMENNYQPWLLMKSDDCITWEFVAWVNNPNDNVDYNNCRDSEISFDIAEYTINNVSKPIMLLHIRSMYTYSGYMVCDLQGNVIVPPTQLYAHDTENHLLYLAPVNGERIPVYKDGNTWKHSHDSKIDPDGAVTLDNDSPAYVWTIPGEDSKGAVFVKDGKLYLVFSYNPLWKNVYDGRTGMQMVKLASDLSLNTIKSYIDMDGYQYFDFECKDDVVYMCATADPRKYCYGSVGASGGCSVAIVKETVFSNPF